MNADPTETEHFRQWATNRKGAPARCMLAAQLEELEVSLPHTSGESIPFHNAPCSTRPSTRSPNEERKCRT